MWRLWRAVLAGLPTFRAIAPSALLGGAGLKPQRSEPSVFREPVVSESIAAIGYDDDAETLEVEFVTGAVYRYRGVSQDVFEDFRQAPSKGAYFNRHIRDAYVWERVG